MNGYNVDGILEPAVEPETSFVTEVPKWCQYFFKNFKTNHGLTG
jgi:hypothetical protein